ncbi:MAG: hypothetical protein ACT4O0_14885 [Pseudonocardia sp.]
MRSRLLAQPLQRGLDHRVFPVASPAVFSPKVRRLGGPRNAASTASPALAVVCPVSTATGGSGQRSTWSLCVT